MLRLWPPLMVEMWVEGVIPGEGVEGGEGGGWEGRLRREWILTVLSEEQVAIKGRVGWGAVNQAREMEGGETVERGVSGGGGGGDVSLAMVFGINWSS